MLEGTNQSILLAECIPQLVELPWQSLLPLLQIKCCLHEIFVYGVLPSQNAMQVGFCTHLDRIGDTML